MTLETPSVLRSRNPGSVATGGFTLIETMLVIALVAIVSVLALPSLSSINRTGKLTEAGNNLADLSALARQEALSRNVITALLLYSTTDAQHNPAFMAAITECASDGTWKLSTKWITFPSILKYTDTIIDSSGGTTPANSTGLPGGASLQMVVNGTSINSDACETFIFYPDGRLAGSAGSSRSLQVSFTSDNAANPTNYFKVLVDADNSALHILRP